MTYSIRPCRTLDELRGCVSLQRRIWGYAEHELYPLRLFVNLAKIGGHVLGAFAGRSRLVGFVASMPAWRGRERYYHSLSLGVLGGYENRGLGRLLKLAQRRAALRAGIELVEWTFDPLRAKNAFFSIMRLGAIARRYLPDHYGSVESRLQLNLPSDRLVAEWWLKSKRVKRVLDGRPPRFTARAPAAVVQIEGDVETLARTRPGRARAEQAGVRRELETCFARRLAITGFEREGKWPRYLLDAMPAAGPR